MELEGGGIFKRNFNVAYADMVVGFDDTHGTNLYAATAGAFDGLPARVSRELTAAGKSNPIFGRHNPAINTAKQDIVVRGITDTREMLNAARNSLRGLVVLSPNEYGDYLLTQARQILGNNIDRETTRYLNQLRLWFYDETTINRWVNIGSTRYIALIQRLNNEIQNALNYLRGAPTNAQVNPLSTALERRPIPRGSTDNITEDEIVNDDIMGDFNGNYSRNVFLKQSTIDSLPKNAGRTINPYNNLPIENMELYLADVALTGGRLCPICYKVVGKKH